MKKAITGVDVVAVVAIGIAAFYLKWWLNQY